MNTGLLSPYKSIPLGPINHDYSFCRQEIGSHRKFFVYSSDKGTSWNNVISGYSVKFKSKEAAIVDLDAKLLKDGYVFVSEERAEKLILLG